MPLSHELQSRLLACLTQLYGELRSAMPCTDRRPWRTAIRPGRPRDRPSLWNEQDVILITYGDQISAPGNTPLATLRRFLLNTSWMDCSARCISFRFSRPHRMTGLPSPTIAKSIRPWAPGTTFGALGQSFDLMFDLVLNHCSARHPWFQDYLAGGNRTAVISSRRIRWGLSAVTRPRSTPVLTPFQTASGERHLWTTFSADQVDLNWANPDVLVEMLDTLLFYVQNGARIIRLDAVAYVWKMIGTSCIHLPQAHVVVKLMRMLLEAAAPGRLLLTETNVPHDENISYFGEGDEAHLVYQFSLPPLLLEAFLSEMLKR